MKSRLILESVSFNRATIDDEIKYVSSVDTDLVSVNSVSITDSCPETAILSANINLKIANDAIKLPGSVYIHLLGQSGTYLGRNRENTHMGFYTKYVVSDTDRTTYKFINEFGGVIPPDIKSISATIEYISKGILSGLIKIHNNVI